MIILRCYNNKDKDMATIIVLGMRKQKLENILNNGQKLEGKRGRRIPRETDVGRPDIVA